MNHKCLNSDPEMSLKYFVFLIILLSCSSAVFGRQVPCQPQTKKHKKVDIFVCHVEEEFYNIGESDQIYLYKSTALEKSVVESDVKHLVINRSKIDGLPMTIFNFFPNLTEIRMFKQYVTEVKPGTFQNARQLKRIDLRNNWIRTLGIQIFKGAEQLERLELNSNMIETINKDSFVGLSKLKLLDLSGNKIKILQEDTFKTNALLARLYLDRNKIQVIPEKLFERNSQLRRIYFFSNPIRKLPYKVFRNVADLQRLNLLSSNCINKNYYFSNLTAEQKGRMMNVVKTDLTRCA